MDSIQGKQILVIDDCPDMRTLVQTALSDLRVQIFTAASGLEGLRKFFSYQPDLVILDVLLPKMSGWEVCQRIRQVSEVPIIILTALDSDRDMVEGLDGGADDFIIKQIGLPVLRARVRAALRRAYSYQQQKSPSIYFDGYLQIDPTRPGVLIRGEWVKLSALECKLLAFLFGHADQVLTLEQILKHVWGQGYQDSVHYVHNYVSRLRQKLEPDPSRPIYLLTEHGVGYRFERQQPARAERAA